MAAASQRYVILTQAPYGGVKSPICTFDSLEGARAWGRSMHWGVQWTALPIIIYPGAATYILLCALGFGGITTRAYTSPSALELLRYGQCIFPGHVPRAIIITANEPPPPPPPPTYEGLGDNSPPPDIMFSPESPPPLRPQSPLTYSAQKWAEQEAAIAAVVEKLRRPSMDPTALAKLFVEPEKADEPDDPGGQDQTIVVRPKAIRPGLASRASCNDLVALLNES